MTEAQDSQRALQHKFHKHYSEKPKKSKNDVENIRQVTSVSPQMTCNSAGHFQSDTSFSPAHLTQVGFTQDQRTKFETFAKVKSRL